MLKWAITVVLLVVRHIPSYKNTGHPLVKIPLDSNKRILLRKFMYHDRNRASMKK